MARHVPRVLLLFEPPDGGAAENVVQLALGLRDQGFEPELAGPLESAIYERARAAGVAVFPLSLERGYGDPQRDLAALRRLVGLIRARRYDLVHCHAAKAGVLGRLAATALRKPVIYTSHSFPFVGDFSEARRIFSIAVERALGPLSDAILCVCESERQEALDHRVADASILHVIYNACAPCQGDVGLDARLSAMREGGPVAAAVTVLRAQKSVDVLLDAAPMVFERVPEARIAVVGDGPLRDELHAHAARLGLDSDERFAFLPFEAPPARHLRAMDLYVLPSSWEAFPIGVLEAMACGVPQVATDVGGTGEAVTPETGRMVPKRDPRALADAMCELLSDPERRAAMAEASRARHSEHYTLDRVVAETAGLYRHVLDRR